MPIDKGQHVSGLMSEKPKAKRPGSLGGWMRRITARFRCANRPH
jgi:hypothetical protein